MNFRMDLHSPERVNPNDCSQSITFAQKGSYQRYFYVLGQNKIWDIMNKFVLLWCSFPSSWVCMKGLFYSSSAVLWESICTLPDIAVSCTSVTLKYIQQMLILDKDNPSEYKKQFMVNLLRERAIQLSHTLHGQQGIVLECRTPEMEWELISSFMADVLKIQTRQGFGPDWPQE